MCIYICVCICINDKSYFGSNHAPRRRISNTALKMTVLNHMDIHLSKNYYENSNNNNHHYYGCIGTKGLGSVINLHLYMYKKVHIYTYI
jgi:hypothetical protein